MDFLLMLLTIFGIILIVILIILFVRLNFTITKIDALLDDLAKKMASVNHVFEVMDKVTNSVSLVNDRIVDMVISFFANVFSRRKQKHKIEEEEI